MKMLFICANPTYKNLRFLCVFIVSLLSIQSHSYVTLQLQPLDATHYELNLDFDIDEYDGIYEQYLNISIDDPDIIMSKIHGSTESTIQYAPAFKNSKSLFLGPCSFRATLEIPSIDHLETAHLYVTYRLLSQKHSQTVALALSPKRNPEPLVSTCTQGVNVHTAIDAQTIAQTTTIRELSIIRTIEPIQAKSLPLIPLGILSTLCALLGLFLIFKGSYAKQKHWRPIASSLGMALIACSLVVAAKAYQEMYRENRSALTFSTKK